MVTGSWGETGVGRKKGPLMFVGSVSSTEENDLERKERGGPLSKGPGIMA